MNSIVVLSRASYVDVDKLFHVNPSSTLSPNRAANVPTEAFDETLNFQVFRGPRHDEFDWALTKVSNNPFKYEIK